MNDFQTVYQQLKTLVDKRLSECFANPEAPYHVLLDAMRYSLNAGGKRLRPVLVLSFCRACGGDVQAALPVACAIEMVHTYSLIHDDLPCMDNDDLRRGKPTNHKVYGECTATLAGDALQAEAFRMILSSKLPADVRAECARMLSTAAGIEGICGGQQLDMEGEGKALDRAALLEIHKRKTASMLIAACCMGVVCGRGSGSQMASAERFADAMGLAFQIRDDVLDEISTVEELGKPIGSDAQEEKTTFMSLFGLEQCQREVHELTDRAIEAVRGQFDDTAFLESLARSMEVRRN